MFDFHFLRSKKQNTITLNIGGIANVTYMPLGKTDDQVIAFDTGPGNMLIDLAVKDFYDKEYDKNGDIAKKGKVDENLLTFLNSNDYLAKKPPKSTGRELFGNEYYKTLLDKIRIITTFIILD